MIEPLARSIHHAEPRIVVVDGAIRLMVLAQDGGVMEDDPNDGEDPRARVVAYVEQATR
jgi:hypothetical protein